MSSQHTLPIKVDKGSGDPIVLIHGLGNNAASWAYVLEHFDYTKNRIIVMDLLGFGDAEKPSNCEYFLKDHTSAVIRTLDNLSISHAIVAGHSMGCLIATDIANERPDLVSELILLGAPLFRRMPRRFDRLKFWRKEDFYSKLFRLVSRQKDLTLAAATGIRKFVPLIKGMEITDETWPAFKMSLRNTIVQTKSYETLCHIKTPTLLVYGILDLFVIKRNLKQAAKSNAEFVTYKSAMGPHEITPVHGKSIAQLIQFKKD